MDTPDQLVTLTPALQWGFAGFSLILVGVIVWMIRRLLDVLRSNTEALTQLTGVVGDVDKVSSDIRDRLLAWKCPYSTDRGGQESHDGPRS
jgi:hypothetical protein